MRDLFTGINWKQTAILNSMRAVCAGIVLAVVFLFGGLPKETVMSYLFGMIFIYWIVIFPMGYLTAKLSEWGVPFVGIFSLFLSLLIAVGDPLLFILSKIFRQLPVSPDFAPFNLAPIFLVLRDDVVHVNVL